MILWFGFVFITAAGSISGLVLAGRARLKGGWAVTGVALYCVLALFLSVAAASDWFDWPVIVPDRRSSRSPSTVVKSGCRAQLVCPRSRIEDLLRPGPVHRRCDLAMRQSTHWSNLRA